MSWNPSKASQSDRLLPAFAGVTLVTAFLLSGVPTALAQGTTTAATVTESSVTERCAQGKVQDIIIQNNSVFDPQDLEQGGRFTGFYEFVNKLHITTIPSFIRKELLLSVGDCYDPFLIQESGRILRGYSFIAQAEVSARQVESGDWVVFVETQDEWTTEFNVVTNFEEGFEFRGLTLTEESVAGSGVRLTSFILSRDAQRDVGIEIQTPNLFRRLDAMAGFGSTRSGHFVAQGFFYPFLGEVGQVGARQIYSRRESLFSYVIEDPSSVSHLTIPLTEKRYDVTAAWRLGHPGNYTVVGLGLSGESFDLTGFGDRLELVRNGDFSNPQVASSTFSGVVADQARGRSTTRLNFIVGERNLSFVRRQGLDALEGVQDVPVGSDVELIVGKSIGIFEDSDLAHANDLFARATLYQGWAPKNFVITVSGIAEGRRIFSDDYGEQGWKDILAESDVYAYWRPNQGSHTFFGRASASGGWSVRTPFQLTLGGPEGVRGFREETYPGSRRIVLTIEDRINVGSPVPSLFDFGFTLFSDAGKVWSGDAPFGLTSDFQASVGGGLRIGFPEGTRTVLRVDVVTPATGAQAWSDFLFRISFGELVGLARGFFDPQVNRSRRAGTSSNLFSVPWTR